MAPSDPPRDAERERPRRRPPPPPRRHARPGRQHRAAADREQHVPPARRGRRRVSLRAPGHTGVACGGGGAGDPRGGALPAVPLRHGGDLPPRCCPSSRRAPGCCCRATATTRRDCSPRTCSPASASRRASARPPSSATQPLDGIDLVFVETPSNPGLDVCDLARVAERARNAAGAVVVADNTTPPPRSCSDRSISVSTWSSPPTPRPRPVTRTCSPGTSPPATRRAWRGCASGARSAARSSGRSRRGCCTRGLATLDLRLERMCRSAQALAEVLAEHPAVSGLRYPGLPSDPSHALAARQMSAFGTLVGVD